MPCRIQSDINRAISILSQGDCICQEWAEDLTNGPPYSFKEVENWVNGDASPIDNELNE